MAIAASTLDPYRFSRLEYYAIANALDSSRRYELVKGAIYAMSPANPPHSGIVRFFANRLRALNPQEYQISVQDTLEIEPDGSPQPDIAIRTAATPRS